MIATAFHDRRAGPQRYPWDRWFATSNHFIIRRGIDFHCQILSMGIQVRKAAARRGYKVSLTSIDGDLDGHEDTIVARITSRGDRRRRGA